MPTGWTKKRGPIMSQGGRPQTDRQTQTDGRTQFAPTKDIPHRGELHSPTNPHPSATPVRKHNRLSGYDYSQQGAYFITICTQNRAEILGHIVGATCGRPQGCPPTPNHPQDEATVGATCGRPHGERTQVAPAIRPYTELSDLGRVVKAEIERLSAIYPMVSVDGFVIMPNHVHMIVVIDAPLVGANCVRPPTLDCSISGRPQVAPTISRIVKQWKGGITKRMGFSPWQKSFHDHIIRSQADYLRIAEYIENNPAQWEMDSLHPKKGEGMS